MPTISKERIKYVGPKGPSEFVREIKVSAIGLFEIALPPDVAEALNETDVGGYSKSEAVKLFDAAVLKSSTKKAVTKRVICYRVLLWGKIARPGKFGDTNPIKHGDTSDYNANQRGGCGLQIEVGVFDETLVESGGRKDYRYAEIDSPIPSSVRLCVDDLNRRNAARFGEKTQNRRWDGQVPWTLEREAFWVRVAAGVENLIIDLHGAFKDEKDALKLIDGKGPLRLTQ